MNVSYNNQNFTDFDRLKAEQEKFLNISDEKIKQWNKFKNDYLSLRDRLETLPHELRYDIMVPISKVAFMPGKLVNTNEILVLLGDNWFVEKSAKQACDMIDRRLKSIDKHLEDLDKENKIMNSQLEWTQNIMKERQEFVNIEEKLDESKSLAVAIKEGETKKRRQLTDEEKKELRKKQQEKALGMQGKIDQEIRTSMDNWRKNISEKEASSSDDEETTEVTEKGDFMQKLADDIEKLDLEQKFEQITKVPDVNGDEEAQLTNMLRDYDRQIDRANNEFMTKTLKDNLEKRKMDKRVKWEDTADDSDDDYDYDYDDDDDDDEQCENDHYSDENEPVKQDEELTKPIRITIKHTKSEKLDEMERNLKVSRDKPPLNSPGDIFNHFYKPKSILKKQSLEDVKTTDQVPSHGVRFGETESKQVVTNENNESKEKFEPQKAFSGEIVERQPVVRTSIAETSTASSSVEPEVKKPVSKFKASKMNK